MSISRPHEQFTGSCFQHGGIRGPAIQTPPASYLWNRPAPSGTVFNDVFDPRGSMEMANALAEKVGKQRLYQSPWLNNPTLGKQFSAGHPPAVPKHSMQPTNMDLADIPFPSPVADPAYRERLFVQPFFRPVPYATNADLYGPSYLNTMVA